MKIKTNSKLIKEGDTFIAIKGSYYDGHNFIDEAIENGASKIICEYGEYDILYEIVPDTREYLRNYLYDNYYDEIKKIKLIGITGTNGKTTSCFLIYELLKKLKVKTAYIGTIGLYIDKKVRDLDNTTPDILELYEILIECKNRGVEVVVMEVSSHALELDRIYGLLYDFAVFTNLTVEHLLFHSTMNNYLNAKKKLFDKVKENGVTITNIDDKYYMHFIKDGTITYGMNDSEYRILKYKLSIDNTKYKFKFNKKKYKVKINMPGKYNIYNSLVAIIVLNKMGYKIKRIIKLLKFIPLPSGRMEVVKYNKRAIIIDYAHTPDAVKNTLLSVHEFNKGKIYTVIGCGGNRDRSKRKDMGIISTDLSDYVIFTNDNSRNEDINQIMSDITSSLLSSNYEVELDRKLAIRKGISLLNKKDILLVLGKGHEEYQVINGIKYYFSDKEEVFKSIEEKR